MMENFTPFSGLIGGLLIGLASVLLLLFNGRIAGVSGIVGGLVSPGGRKAGDTGWRAAFVAGLMIGGLGYAFVGNGLTVGVGASLPVLVAAGLLVGFGTRLGNGCTSGHAVSGIARLSRRSVAATATFVGVATLTVFIVRHVL